MEQGLHGPTGFPWPAAVFACVLARVRPIFPQHPELLQPLSAALWCLSERKHSPAHCCPGWTTGRGPGTGELRGQRQCAVTGRGIWAGVGKAPSMHDGGILMVGTVPSTGTSAPLYSFSLVLSGLRTALPERRRACEWWGGSLEGYGETSMISLLRDSMADAQTRQTHPGRTHAQCFPGTAMRSPATPAALHTVLPSFSFSWAWRGCKLFSFCLMGEKHP